MCFINVNELKLNQVELFLFFHFKCVMHPNSFAWPFKQIMNAFYAILTFNFKLQITYINLLDWAEENQLKCKKIHILMGASEITQGELFSVFHLKSALFQELTKIIMFDFSSFPVQKRAYSFLYFIKSIRLQSDI